ncbi:MAG: hypothetical protein K6G90_12950 [Clostridia bacterium]|nr:hypothetical protein [Clostridia bacterium]
MKKSISVLLSCLMLMSLFVIGASAAGDVVIAANQVYTEDVTIGADGVPVVYETGFTVKPGVTVILASEVTVRGSVTNEGGTVMINGMKGTHGNPDQIAGLILESGAAFFNNNEATGQKRRGTLQVGTYGGLRVKLGARIENRGDVIGLENENYITVEGDVINYYRLPASTTVPYSADVTYDGEAHSVTYTANYLLDGDMLTDDAYKYTDANDSARYQYQVYQDTEIPVHYGEPLYVLIRAKTGSSEADFVDTSRLKLNCGGQLLYAENIENTRRGVFVIIPVSKNNKLTSPASALSYVGSLKYEDVVKQFTITLPRNSKAYYVISLSGDVDRTVVNYGETFDFRVVLSDAYSGAAENMTVYAGTDKIKPDDAGVYHLDYGPNDIGGYGMLRSGDGIRSDVNITVNGVISDENNERFSNITGGLRNLLNVFKKILSYFSDLFSNFGNIFG